MPPKKQKKLIDDKLQSNTGNINNTITIGDLKSTSKDSNIGELDNTDNKKNTKCKSNNKSGKKLNTSSSKNGKKKDKLTYNESVKNMDIMAEFTRNNKNIIVKFPYSCIKNTAKLNELEYNPDIIDPTPYDNVNKLSHPLENIIYNTLNDDGMMTNNTDNTGNSSITNKIGDSGWNIPDGSTSVDELRKDIYEKYITAGSNTTLNINNLLFAQKTLDNQKNIMNNTNMSTTIGNVPYPPTLLTSCTQLSTLPIDTSGGHIDINTIEINNSSNYHKQIDDLLSEFTTPEKRKPMTQIEILLHKKYNQTKQIELMHSMCCYVNTHQQWPKTCNSACLWDCHNFQYMPWGIPMSYDSKKKTFELYGVFCSPNCALAYLMKEERNIGTMWEKVSLLNLLYHIIYNAIPHNNDDVNNKNDNGQNKRKDINIGEMDANNKNKKWGNENLVPAPDKMTLHKFGGPLSIEQFRCLTINNNKQYHIVFPPCNFVSPILEESKKVFANDNNFIPLGSNYFSKIENNLKIKRSKPISAPVIKSNREKWPTTLRKHTGIMRAITGQNYDIPS